jgi:pyrroline-5-carboxylate reductase
VRIGILGGGTMGEIITRALIAKEIVRPADIVIAEMHAERREHLAAHGVGLTAKAAALADGCDLLLLCVKPQDASAALAPLAGRLPADSAAVSIMAGIDLAFLAEHLAHPAVIRSMPNLPSRIGAGVTVWISAPAVPDRLRVISRMVFQALGKEVEVTDEGLLDAATAVSGTGPAYIFYIAENLLSAALDFGFDEGQALKLVRETFRGAMNLWAETGESPAELRRKVTSKGGTTHAAVTHFQEADIAGIFLAGVRRAHARAKELAEIAKSGAPGAP